MKTSETMQRLTREQAAVISAYTGFLAGPFSDMHDYAEKLLHRPVWTHEFGSKKFSEELRQAAKDVFLSITAE